MVKRLIIGVLFLFLTVSSQAQNMLGYSVKDIKENLNTEGVIITSGYTTDDNTYYITGRDATLMRVYYFDSNNRCVVYLAFIDTSKEQLSKSLINIGYYKVGETFYKDDYKVVILYDEDIELHYMQFTFK